MSRVRPGPMGERFLELTKRSHPKAWRCQFCGIKCWYPPIKIPIERPKSSPDADKFGLIEVLYATMCANCIPKRHLKLFRKKVRDDEMTPLSCWAVLDGEMVLVDLEEQEQDQDD